MRCKCKGHERLGRSRPETAKQFTERDYSITPSRKHRIKATCGLSVIAIDALLTRARAQAICGSDYAATVEAARGLAAFSERRAA